MKSSPTKRPNLHTSTEIWVVPYRKNWALQLDHDEKPFVVVSQDKEKAVDMGRNLAQTREIELVIFDRKQREERREDHRTAATPRSPRKTSSIRRPK